MILLSLRGGKDGGFGGLTLGHVVKRKAPKTRTATAARSLVTRRRVRKRTTVTKTTRLSGAERGGIGTERDEAQTPRHLQTMTYLQMMTPANIVVFQITLSWWVHWTMLYDYMTLSVYMHGHSKYLLCCIGRIS